MADGANKAGSEGELLSPWPFSFWSQNYSDPNTWLGWFSDELAITHGSIDGDRKDKYEPSGTLSVWSKPFRAMLDGIRP